MATQRSSKSSGSTSRRKSSGSTTRKRSSGSASAKKSTSSASAKRSQKSRSGRQSDGQVSPAEIIERAREQARELTGRQVEGVLGLERGEDGWEVTIELVELRRVPNSTDVLASYTVSLDDEGELQEYRRTRRYYRSQIEEG